MKKERKQEEGPYVHGVDSADPAALEIEISVFFEEICAARGNARDVVVEIYNDGGCCMPA
jgi:hypothetical protein